jgi:hypothetical protein
MQLADNDAYTSNVSGSPLFPGRAQLLLGLWLSGALWVVGSGAFARAPAAVLPLTVGGLTALSLGAVLSDREGRPWADAVSRGRLAWFHAWRAVPGGAFLVLYAHGSLPWGFAVPGGVGDLAIALTAPIAAWASRRTDTRARLGYLAWNALGFLDLANVVREGALHTRIDPASMHLLRELPLGLLPAFAVPLTFAAHALAVRRRPTSAG